MTISDPSANRRIATLERQVELLTRRLDTQTRGGANYKEPRDLWIGRTVKNDDEDYPGPESNTFRVELLAPVFDDSAPGAVVWPNAWSESYLRLNRGTQVIAQGVQNTQIPAIPGNYYAGGYYEEGSLVVVARIARSPLAGSIGMSGGWWIISGQPAGLLVASDANSNSLTSTGSTYALSLPIGSAVVVNKAPYWEVVDGATLKCKRNGFYTATLSVTFEADGIDCWPNLSIACSTFDFWNLGGSHYFHGVGSSTVKTQVFTLAGVMGFYTDTLIGASISVPSSYGASVRRVTNMLLSLEYIRTAFF